MGAACWAIRGQPCWPSRSSPTLRASSTVLPTCEVTAISTWMVRASVILAHALHHVGQQFLQSLGVAVHVVGYVGADARNQAETACALASAARGVIASAIVRRNAKGASASSRSPRWALARSITSSSMTCAAAAPTDTQSPDDRELVRKRLVKRKLAHPQYRIERRTQLVAHFVEQQAGLVVAFLHHVRLIAADCQSIQKSFRGAGWRKSSAAQGVDSSTNPFEAAEGHWRFRNCLGMDLWGLFGCHCRPP